MHLHYSPFQFATVEQVAQPKKQVVKEKKYLVNAHAARIEYPSL